MNIEVLNIENKMSNTPFRVIDGLDNSLYFVGSDVAQIINLKTPQKMYARLKDNEKILITPKNWQSISQDFINLENSVKERLSDTSSTILSSNDKEGITQDCSYKEQSSRDFNKKNASNDYDKDISDDSSYKEQTDELGIENNFKTFARKLGINSNAFKIMLITECGFYNVVFGSRSRQAQKIKDWVIEEVLPEIRKRNSEKSKMAGINFVLQSYTEAYHNYQKLNSMLKDKIENKEQNIKDKEKQIIELENKIAKLKKIIVELI